MKDAETKARLSQLYSRVLTTTEYFRRGRGCQPLNDDGVMEGLLILNSTTLAPGSPDILHQATCSSAGCVTGVLVVVLLLMLLLLLGQH